MSSEAGGGIMGGVFVAVLLGPIILKALVVLVTGAAVVGAVALAVSVARDKNEASRAKHEAEMSSSIKKTGMINPTLAVQRQSMLKMYQEQSEALADLSKQQNLQHEKLIAQAKQFAGDQKELQNLQTRSRTLMKEMSDQLSQSVSKLNIDIKAQLTSMQADVLKELKQREIVINKKLTKIANVLDRNNEALAEAVSMMNEVYNTYQQLIAEPDADTLIESRLKALKKLHDDYDNLISKKMGMAALATVTSFTQQTMEAYHRLDLAHHKRQLLEENLRLRTAALNAMMESGTTIQCECVQNLPTEADYWVNGALKPLIDRANELLKQAGQGATMSVAEYEKLLMDVDTCTRNMSDTLNRARQAFVCAYLRIQMLSKARMGFIANGWKAERFGFIDGDFRKPAVMRFSRGTGMADLMLIPIFNTHTGECEVEVKIERSDAGVIDEKLRQAQYSQLSQMLEANGLPVHLSCKKETVGRNAPLDGKIFSNPARRTTN